MAEFDGVCGLVYPHLRHMLVAVEETASGDRVRAPACNGG